jgi:hypothetical protein
MRSVLEKICRENQNTHSYIQQLFQKSCRLLDNMKKYTTVGQATADNTAHGLCTLDN